MKRMIGGWVFLLISTLVVASSCSKDPLEDLTEEESRIYITNHESAADFNSYKTYSIVDSVSLIDNGRFAGRDASSWDLQVISAIQNALNARGFTKVDRTQAPDLGINVSRIYSTSTNYVNLNDYWGYYDGFYDPFYWGYGGYNYYFPPTYGVYQSTEAALSIDMLDLKNATSSQTIKGVWNGLIRGEGIFVSSNIPSQVQALFDQSPYLKTSR